MVRPPSDRAGLHLSEAGLLCTAVDEPARGARVVGAARRVERHRLHAGVRPAVLSRDAAAPRAAGDPARRPAIDPGPEPAVQLRPLRPTGTDHADGTGPALDRPGELS